MRVVPAVVADVASMRASGILKIKKDNYIISLVVKNQRADFL